MDDLLIKVVVRLASVYESLGVQVYSRAAHNALLGIARAVHEEAEEKASWRRRRLTVGPVVVPFPGQTRKNSGSQEEGAPDN